MIDSTTGRTAEQLKMAANSLRQELSRLYHELRRVGDGLKRNGSSHRLAYDKNRLKANIDLCEKDLQNIVALQRPRQL